MQLSDYGMSRERGFLSPYEIDEVFLPTRFDEIELYRIKDVRMNFTLLNQLTGIGTICLTTSDETTRAGDFLMRDVPRAHARREELRRLVDAARRKRGVREIDMVHEDI